MSKQTAVDFLLDNMHYSTSTKWQDIIDKSKEMEKEQIIDAWEDGHNSFSSINVEQYYKETYTSNIN
jgi:hypothetical protein